MSAGQLQARYSVAFQTVLAAAVAPAGYTIANWGAGAALLSARGVPSLGESLLYVGGAALTLAVLRPGGRSAPVAGSTTLVDVVGRFHWVSASISVGVAAAVAACIPGSFAWAIAAALATVTFFGLSALALAALRPTAGDGGRR